MSAVKILLALSCLVGAYGALPKAQPVLKLPSYVGKGCSRNDPKINECVVRVGAPAIKQVAQGDPKYRIPKLDPLLVDEIKVQQGTRQVGLSLSCKKCLIHGLQNTIFNRAVVNWDKRTCEWYLTLDKMRLTGKYNVSGQVLLLPIVGSGNMEMELKDLTFEYKYDWYYEKRDNGLEYVIIDNSTFPFDVNFMSISLENLFNGDKLLGGNMNRFLNENWRDILKDLRPALSKSLGALTKSILQSMANVVPFDIMFPKKYPL
nr:protein takeout-like [Halyomorpha halys]